MMRKSPGRKISCLLALVISLLASIVLAPAASAASTPFGYGGCSVQVNKPHESEHKPGVINIEFRAYGCSVSTGIEVWTKVQTAFRRSDLSTGGITENTYTHLDTISTNATGVPSSVYRNNIACPTGWLYTKVDVQAQFRRAGRTVSLSETLAKTFTCVGAPARVA